MMKGVGHCPNEMMPKGQVFWHDTAHLDRNYQDRKGAFEAEKDKEHESSILGEHLYS